MAGRRCHQGLEPSRSLEFPDLHDSLAAAHDQSFPVGAEGHATDERAERANWAGVTQLVHDPVTVARVDHSHALTSR